jgi:hypothetical protein
MRVKYGEREDGATYISKVGNMIELDIKDSDVVVFDKALLDANFGSFGRIPKEVRGIPRNTDTFFHSYWSAPAIYTNRWDLEYQHELSLAYTALSLALLKQLGQKVDLYTDNIGYELLGCLPYDNFYGNLEDLKTDPRFFAAGKVVGLQLAPADTYIDTDVFIYSASVVDKIHDATNVVSHMESTAAYTALIKRVNDSLGGKLQKTAESYNMGVVKLSDVRPYSERYFDYMKQIIEDETLLADIDNHTGGLGHGANGIVDLVIEQLNLYNHQRCTTLVKESNFRYDGTEDFGISHLIFIDKYTKIPYVLEALKAVDNHIYNTVLGKWKELGFTVEY